MNEKINYMGVRFNDKNKISKEEVRIKIFTILNLLLRRVIPRSFESIVLLLLKIKTNLGQIESQEYKENVLPHK